MSKISKNMGIFWDYDTNKMDLKNTNIKIWYLNRKLQFGDFSNIKKADLKKYLSKLNISPSLKRMLKNYLIKYG
ncbi:MAG: hypothetical protein ABIG60_03810 [Patescibacteria group bacterium]